MRQPSRNSGSVTIITIIPSVPFGWNEVPQIQGILKLFSFLQTAVIVLENYPKAAPLSWPCFSFLSNMLFSPILPLWFNSGNISWFQEALLFSHSKKCSRMVGVPSHPPGGEKNTTPALTSVKPPSLSFFADFCQAKAIGFFLEKRKCGSFEGNIVWDTPMSMWIGTCEGTLGRKMAVPEGPPPVSAAIWRPGSQGKLKQTLYRVWFYYLQTVCYDLDQITHLITFGKRRRNSQLFQWPWSKRTQSEKCHTGAIIQKKFYSNEWKGSY